MGSDPVMSNELSSPQLLERKLTTILSADVAQYSRLMAEDEPYTHSMLTRRYSNLLSRYTADAFLIPQEMRF